MKNGKLTTPEFERMSAENGADQESARRALLTRGKALAPRAEPSGAAAPPLPSAALEALKMAYLSGQDPEHVLKRFQIGSQAGDDKPAGHEAAPALAADLAGKIQRAWAKLEELESRQTDLATKMNALDKRLSELEADRRGAKTG
jgi:hypothetical protein